METWKTITAAYWNKKWQVTYIAPLNHLPLLPSGPGGVQQELVV